MRSNGASRERYAPLMALKETRYIRITTASQYTAVHVRVCVFNLDPKTDQTSGGKNFFSV